MRSLEPLCDQVNLQCPSPGPSLPPLPSLEAHKKHNNESRSSQENSPEKKALLNKELQHLRRESAEKRNKPGNGKRACLQRRETKLTRGVPAFCGARRQNEEDDNSGTAFVDYGRIGHTRFRNV